MVLLLLLFQYGMAGKDGDVEWKLEVTMACNELGSRHDVSHGNGSDDR